MCQRGIDLVNWSLEWALPLLEEKSMVLYLGSKNNEHDHRLGTSVIEKVEQVRDLGFQVQRDVSFQLHCDCIISKTSVVIYSIFHSLSTRNSAILLQAYKLYVRSLVEFGTAVFNPYKDKVDGKIEKVQKSFTRKFMTGSTIKTYHLRT